MIYFSNYHPEEYQEASNIYEPTWQTYSQLIKYYEV